jgi:hypothetical protein
MKEPWIALLLSATASMAQTYQKAPPEAEVPAVPTREWISRIEQLAPAQATAKPSRKRAVLLFSLTTGFQHSVRPYAAEVIKTLANKTGAFTVVESLDIESFAPENLARFDAVILNNCCPDAKNHNLFLDVLTSKVDQSIKDIGLKYKAVIYGDNLDPTMIPTALMRTWGTTHTHPLSLSVSQEGTA